MGTWACYAGEGVLLPQGRAGIHLCGQTYPVVLRRQAGWYSDSGAAHAWLAMGFAMVCLVRLGGPRKYGNAKVNRCRQYGVPAVPPLPPGGISSCWSSCREVWMFLLCDTGTAK